jgi:flagellar motor switch protein FliM
MSGIEGALAQTLGGEGLAEESSGVLSGTSLEQRLVDWFLEPFATCLAESVAAGLDLDANVGRIGGKVEFDRYFPDAESYFRVGFQMRFRTGNAQLKSVDGELAFSDVALSPLIGCVLGCRGGIKDRHELVAVMARSTISPEDFAQIEVGDVIATEVDAHGEFGLEYLGNRVCSVVPGLLHGRKAVRVVQ